LLIVFWQIRLLERIEQAEGTPLKTRVYIKLMELCAARNELELAFLVHDRALQPVTKNGDAGGHRVLNRSLIGACIQTGNSRKALDLIDSLIAVRAL
jgi:hypothetical protein